MVAWDEVKGDFEPDGALRDIYVIDATVGVWEAALAFLLSGGTARFTIDDVEASLPATASDALRMWPDHTPLLLVVREGIEYACHFFVDDKVELDFWPEEIEGRSEFASLCSFVVGLGRATRRAVLVTHEGSEHAEIFRYVPETDAIEISSAGRRRTSG